MRIDWSQEDLYGRATNPETGDEVLVGWDIHRDKMVYQINGGPFQDAARHIRAKGLDTAGRRWRCYASTSRNAKPPTGSAVET